MRQTLELETFDAKPNHNGTFEIKGSILETTVENTIDDTIELLKTAGMLPKNVTKDTVYMTGGRAW